MSGQATRVCLVTGLALMTLPASAPAMTGPITGRLSKPGYTVIALAASGKARAVRAPAGSFRITRPARTVTLHLRAPDGTYAGPIVIGVRERGKRAILGVRAGTSLGSITVRAARGYAKAKRRPAKRHMDVRRSARARRGVPIGAGNFGRVRSRKTGGGMPGDTDLDGVPAPLDIDDDGDLVLDDNDRSSVSRAARAAQAQSDFHAFTRMTLQLGQTVNANRADPTPAEIDAAVSSFSHLLVSVLPGDASELDCGGALTGLAYCRPGGSGRVFEPGVPPSDWLRFPGCCDADGDGFGTLRPDPNVPPHPGLPGMTLHHGATTAEIRTGDVLIERVTTGGVETAYPSTQQYVFATVPALVSFTDSAGNVTTVPPPYSLPEAVPGPGMLGTHGNGFPVTAGPNGRVVLTLTYWRPQRTPIPGEDGYGVPGAWTDIGGLVYSPQLSGSGFRCPSGTLDEADPDLEAERRSNLPALSNDQGGLIDRAPDRPASPDNTFTFTLDVTQCLAANGLSFDVGEERDIELAAITPSFAGVAIQPFSLRHR